MNVTKIYYGLVSRERIVLCDSDVASCSDKRPPGGYESLCQLALEHVESTSRKRSKQEYVHREGTGNLWTYVYRSMELCYVCVAANSFTKKLAFACLREVEKQFRDCDLKGKATVAGLPSLQSRFSSTLHSILSEYSSQDKLGKVEKARDAVVVVVRNTVDEVIEEGNDGEDLDGLLKRANALKNLPRPDFRRLKKHGCVYRCLRHCCCSCFRSS